MRGAGAGVIFQRRRARWCPLIGALTGRASSETKGGEKGLLWVCVQKGRQEEGNILEIFANNTPLTSFKIICIYGRLRMIQFALSI